MLYQLFKHIWPTEPACIVLYWDVQLNPHPKGVIFADVEYYIVKVQSKS